MTQTKTEKKEAARRLKEWRLNPLKFVHECLGVTPDAWQEEVMLDLGKPGRKRVAMKACAGPGKTAVLAWAGWHRLACFAAPNEHPKGIAVSITGDNLRRNLWAEMARWQNASSFLRKAFEWTGSRIAARDHPETWFLSATSWPKTADLETIGRTLSGLHSRFPFYLIDESGDIPPNMLRSAEQGLSSCEDGLIVTAGNTTSQSGLLYEVSTRLRGSSEEGKWDVISITADPDDPKRTPRVDIEWARQQIAAYGRDNPWVMAYVLGQFPPGSINALISVEEVEAAMNRDPKVGSYEWAAGRVGVDVARFGDDRTVLFPRQGLAGFQPKIMRHARGSSPSVDIANSCMAIMNERGFEEAYCDDSGGWGHGAVDVLRSAGRDVYAVLFENRQTRDPRFYNLRAEMWWMMAEWAKGHGCLPMIPELIPELATPTYGFKDGKIIIEPKDQVKTRLGRSPDCFVAGTLVSTPDGERAIESLKCGDMVLTPMGKRKVLHRWETEAVELTTAMFSNGAQLTGKGKHEVFVWGKGWVRLDALSLSNAIETDNAWRRAKWNFLSSLFTPVESSGFKAIVATTNPGAMRTPRDFFIAGCGLTRMAQSLKAATYITRTVIGHIRSSRIWNASRTTFTARCICASGFWPRPRNTVQPTPERCEPLPSGIAPRLECNGIESMARKHGMAGRLSRQPARSAEACTRRSFVPALASVPAHASSERGTSGIRRQLVSALSAVRDLRSIVTGSKSVVPVSVQTAAVRSVKVYNLTLDADNAYYANGILVANCADALGLTFALPDTPSRVKTGFEKKRTSSLDEYDPYARMGR